jgi:hypothetical protein
MTHPAGAADKGAPAGPSFNRPRIRLPIGIPGSRSVAAPQTVVAGAAWRQKGQA